MRPRISERRYEHFEQVDVSNISACFSAGKDYRWTLDIPYKPESGRTEAVSVILKNPSAANEHLADRTIQNIEKQIYRIFPAAAMLTILNLFAIRGTDTKDVNDIIESSNLSSAIGDKNDYYIRQQLAKSHHIVVAWGAQSAIRESRYRERVGLVAEILKEFRHNLWYVGCMSDEEYPLHGMQWKTEHQKIRIQSDWRSWQNVGP